MHPTVKSSNIPIPITTAESGSPQAACLIAGKNLKRNVQVLSFAF